MRTSENDSLGLVSTLKRAVRPSKRCALGSSNDELGVGANASSRADMIFVTNDSFSELMWSPNKGLSIRCAVRSVAEKNSSFFWGAGLGDMVLSPPHIIGTGTDHQNFAKDRISTPPSNEAVDQTASLRSSDRNKRQSGSCDSINTSSRINCVQDDTAVEGATESNSRVLADRRLEKVLPDADDRLVHAGSVGEKLECVAENDLLPSDNFVPNSIVNIRNSLHGGTKQIQLEVCEISKASPIRALASERKGKEKALSDDNAQKGASSQEDDDSYESVESCNSARRVSAGKKRVRSFKEQLIDGSKRLKMQVRKTPGSSSFNRSNSSFANWISTMIKGLPRPDEGGDPSLALPSPVNEMKAFGTSSREQDKTCDSMGFKTHFQSIYQPVPKVQDARLLCSDNYQEIEGCEKLKLKENSGEANSSRDDVLAIKDDTSKSLNQSLLGAAQDSFLHSTGLNGNVDCDPLDSKIEASSKRFWLNMDSTETRDVGSSRNLIAGKVATNIFGKGCSDLPSAEKVAHTSVKKDDHFSGFFMNHFSPKSPRPVHDSQRNIGCFFEDRKNVKLQGSSSEKPTNSAFKKLHNYLLDVEASSANPIEAQNINQRFTSSEAMASVFAKRLDAFKNILRSDLTDKSASSATTCFFCGITGHDLRCCPQVTETEVDELLRNFAAYGGREDSACLCIRCFQLNHWAAACPNAPSRKKNKAEIWHQKGFRRNLSLLDQGLSATTAWASASPGYYKPPGVSTGLYVNLEMKESAAFSMKASSNLQNVNPAKPEENASELPGFPYPCGSLATHAFTMPKGIFDAVKSLRLSRNDIMKWMNSIFSTSLDGYYLRLRRKLGEGLGGTQYHVACICGTQEGKSAETSKGPISVIVDGIRCSVETQYISNQDFLEDELKTWWSATLRGDGRIPLEDELRSKVEERRRLGL